MDEPRTPAGRPPLVVTIAGGGSYAFGFALGIAHGLAAEGIDITKVPLVGTSGGSHAAVAIAARLSFDDVEPIWSEYVANAGRIWVRAAPLTEALYGDVDVEGVAGVAIRLRWFKRMLLWTPEYRAADIVAASSSPFPFVRPHKIGKRRFIDGGHRSNSSADIVPAADLQLVLAAFADKRQGFIGRLAARAIPKETAKWREAHGGRTLVIPPNDDIFGIAAKTMKDMGDMGIGRRVHDLAVPLGIELAGILRRDHPDVVARITSSPVEPGLPGPASGPPLRPALDDPPMSSDPA